MATSDDTGVSTQADVRRHKQISTRSGVGEILKWAGNFVYPAFNRIRTPGGEFITELGKTLDAAQIDRDREEFITEALGYSVFLGLIFSATTFAIGFVTFFLAGVAAPAVGINLPTDFASDFLNANRKEILLIVSVTAAAIVGAVVGFSLRFMSVWFAVRRQEREVTRLLPDTISYMHSLGGSGLTHIEIIRAVADSPDVFGAVSEEMQVIVNEMDYFDTDYRQAIANRAQTTPSDNLRDLLTDMLSVIDAGGDIEYFFEKKQEKFERKRRKKQESRITALENSAQVFLIVTLLPALAMLGGLLGSFLIPAAANIIVYVPYIFTPLVGMVVLILVSTMKQDDLTDGVIKYTPEVQTQNAVPVVDANTQPIETPEINQLSSVLADYQTTVEDAYAGKFGNRQIVNKISRYGTISTIKNFFRHPLPFFIWQPYLTLLIGTPIALTTVVFLVTIGYVPLIFDFNAMLDQYLRTTIVYLTAPITIIGVIYGIFWEWRARAESSIVSDMPDTLRDIESANATGQTVLESFAVAAKTASGRMSEELQAVIHRVRYGDSLQQSLIRFNNKYSQPQLARVIKLIIDAQKINDNISPVIATAAEIASTNQQLKDELKSATAVQSILLLAIVGVSFVMMTAMAGVFVPVIEDISSGAAEQFAPGLAQLEPDRVEAYLFHTSYIQAITVTAGVGYLKTGDISASVKYMVGVAVLIPALWYFTLPIVSAISA